MTVLNPISDDRVMNAPRLPEGRPPTRMEVWAREHALYYDRKRHKLRDGCSSVCKMSDEFGELEARCREGWVWYYVAAFNFKGWRKQPEWIEGNAVVPEAVPTREFTVTERSTWAETVYRCLNTASQSGRKAT